MSDNYWQGCMVAVPKILVNLIELGISLIFAQALSRATMENPTSTTRDWVGWPSARAIR